MTNELCLPRLKAIIMLIDVYGVVCEDHMAVQKRQSFCKPEREREYVHMLFIFYD